MIRSRKTADGKKAYTPLVYNPATGRKEGAQKVLKITTPGVYATEREAKRVERLMVAAVEELADPTRGQHLTVAELVERWLTEYPRPRETTNKHYQAQLKPLVAEFGDVLVSRFTRRYALQFATKHPRNAKVAKAMWNDAMYPPDGQDPFGGATLNPFYRLRLEEHSRRRKSRKLALRAEEVQALVDASGVLGRWGVVMGAMIEFSAYTGLRLGELCALEWDWVSDDRRRLTVRRQISKFGVPTATKNGTGDTRDAVADPQRIALLPPALDALGRVPRSLSGLVFTLPGGKRMSHQGHHYYWRQVRSAFLSGEHDRERLVQLDRLVWHSLRHTTSTLLIEAGFSRFEVQAQMRHSDPSLVDLTYTHIDEERAWDRMIERFSGKGLGAAEGVEGADSA